jgi:hypothetical protein
MEPFILKAVLILVRRENKPPGSACKKKNSFVLLNSLETFFEETQKQKSSRDGSMYN